MVEYGTHGVSLPQSGGEILGEGVIWGFGYLRVIEVVNGARGNRKGKIGHADDVGCIVQG